MEQASQQKTGKSGFDDSGFVRAKFGKAVEFTADLLEGSDWRGPLEQIGTAEIHGLKATIHFSAWKAEIQLSNSAEIREIRSRCQSIEGGPLPLCRLSRAGQTAVVDREVNVEFIFAAEQVHLPGKLHFRVNDSVAVSANWTGDRSDFPKQLLKSLFFRTGKGSVLLGAFSGMMGESNQSSPDIIELLNSNGDTALCRIWRSTGSGWLEVVGYNARHQDSGKEERKKKVWTSPRIRIFGFEEPPILDLQLTGGDLAPLEVLQHKRSTFLGCWKRYRELLNQMGQVLFEQRKSLNLTFRAGVLDKNDPTCHRVHIANWHDARACWGEVKDLSVFVAKDQNGLVEDASRANAELVSVSPEGDARIRWKGASPYDCGVIMIAKYSVANEKRVVAAIGRLEKGLSAYPDLMSVLNNPTAAVEPAKRTLKPRGETNYDESQSEAIAKALGNRSVVAIQGPPGTGKTRVIVGIIKECYRKNRTRLNQREDTPFRVLISSAQNVAVFNAVDLLKTEGVLIDQRLSGAARDDEDNAARISSHQEYGEQVANLIQGRMNKEPGLKFQAERSDAVTRILRELTEVTKSENPVEALKEAFSRWLSPSFVLPDDLSQLIELHAKRIEGRDHDSIPDSDTRDNISKVETFLSGILSADQILDQSDELTELEHHFDSAGFSSLHEEIREHFRKHLRATRDHEFEASRTSFDEIRQTAASALEDIRLRGSLMENALETDSYTETSSCIEALANELDGYRQVIQKQVGGVLAEWRNAWIEEPGLWKRLEEKYAEIRGATCQMASPQPTWDGIDVSEQYDLVVIDEAARTDPGELLIPLTLGKALLLVGDQKQLPPYIDDLAARKLQQDDPTGLDLLREQSYFNELFESLPESNKTMLNRQYRCHPVIGAAISQAFYDGRLSSGPPLPADYASWAASKTPTWEIFDNHPLCWRDTDRMNSGLVSTNCNPLESEWAVEIINKVISTIVDEGKQIGVIAFYREQLKHLQAQLEQAIPNYNRLIELGTVDSFQGKEFPFVILLTSRCDPKSGRVGFLELPNRVNVAVSRAQSQLVILGSRSTLLHNSKGSMPFKNFVAAAGQNMKFHP